MKSLKHSATKLQRVLCLSRTERVQLYLEDMQANWLCKQFVSNQMLCGAYA